VDAVHLHPERDRSVRLRHPWLFAGAIARVEGGPQPGDTVEVYGSDGSWLARGSYSPHSQIRVRLVTWEREEPVDAALWRRRLERALAARAALDLGAPGGAVSTNAYRLVHAESDGLPGLIADRYGDTVIAQFLTAGAERWKAELSGLFAELTGARGVFERGDDEVRAREGLAPAGGLLAGAEPPEALEVRENGLRFLVDVRHGHKTGFYLDQRENRRILGAHCAGAELLNGFAYTGGFAVYALAGGARHVANVESSADLLGWAERNAALNGQPAGENVAGNVFSELRRFRAEQRRFDAIVLDPPKFAHSRRELDRAGRGYKDINLLAFQLLRPGGLLATFSCSGAVSRELFQQIVFGAATDAGRDAQIVARLGAGPDHPVLLAFPEGEYLKGLLLRVW
jgi:23S rRNA (cytosine1962-C5)-methyltransferase